MIPLHAAAVAVTARLTEHAERERAYAHVIAWDRWARAQFGSEYQSWRLASGMVETVLGLMQDAAAAAAADAAAAEAAAIEATLSFMATCPPDIEERARVHVRRVGRITHPPFGGDA